MPCHVTPQPSSLSSSAESPLPAVIHTVSEPRIPRHGKSGEPPKGVPVVHFLNTQETATCLVCVRSDKKGALPPPLRSHGSLAGIPFPPPLPPPPPLCVRPQLKVQPQPFPPPQGMGALT